MPSADLARKPSIFALILAGGRSRRFGREKAAAELGGRPLMAHVAQALAAGTQELAVSAPDGSAAAAYAEAHGLTRLPDPPGAWDGPLTGVAAGLRWAAEGGAAWLVTAPCDAPFLPQDLTLGLVDGAGPGGAYAVTDDGPQPLCTLWPTSALAAIGRYDKHPPVRALLAELGARPVRFEDAAAFANINTPEAFAAAQARMQKGRRPGPSPL